MAFVRELGAVAGTDRRQNDGEIDRDPNDEPLSLLPHAPLAAGVAVSAFWREPRIGRFRMSRHAKPMALV